MAKATTRMNNILLKKGEKQYLCEQLKQKYEADSRQTLRTTTARESYIPLANALTDFIDAHKKNFQERFSIEFEPNFEVSDGQLQGLFGYASHRDRFLDACYIYLHDTTRAEFLRKNPPYIFFADEIAPPQYNAQNEALTSEKEAELTEEIQNLLKKVDALEADKTDKNGEIAQLEAEKSAAITQLEADKNGEIVRIEAEKSAAIAQLEGEKNGKKSSRFGQLKWLVPILIGSCIFLINPCKKNESITWYMTTAWDGNTSFICEALRNVTKEVYEETDGAFRIMISNNLQLPDSGRTLSMAEIRQFVGSDAPNSRIQMVHSSKYYYHDSISPSLIFFSAIPFGMDYKQTKQWIGEKFLDSERQNWAEGYTFWQQINEKAGVISFPCGHSDAQWGGWYKKPIQNIDDFKGQKIRISGFAGRVLDSLGAKTCALFQYQLLQAMQSDTLFAAEWINAVDDYKMGLYKARSYKWVNNETWNEPNSMFELTINRKAFNALSPGFQKTLVDAIKNMNKSMSSEFVGRGQSEKYENLIAQEGVQYFKLPSRVRDTLEQTTRRLLYQHVVKYEKTHPEIRKIYNSYLTYCPNLKYTPLSK